MTVDASDFNSNSASRNTQFSAYNDFEYRFTPLIAALGRIGYQNLQYPFAPAATFAGPTWLAGGRLGVGGGYGFVSLEYGRQEGVYGFTGAASFNLTPTMTVNANLVQGISTPVAIPAILPGDLDAEPLWRDRRPVFGPADGVLQPGPGPDQRRLSSTPV